MIKTQKRKSKTEKKPKRAKAQKPNIPKTTLVRYNHLCYSVSPAGGKKEGWEIGQSLNKVWDAKPQTTDSVHSTTTM